MTMKCEEKARLPEITDCTDRHTDGGEGNPESED